MIGIYKITNKLNGKSYIGQSIHCGKRLDEHCVGSQFIDEVIQLDGIENFTFEIIKECEKNELAYWEDYYIIQYNTFFPSGYNKRWNCSEDIRKNILKLLAQVNKADIDISIDKEEKEEKEEKKEDTKNKCKITVKTSLVFTWLYAHIHYKDRCVYKNFVPIEVCRSLNIAGHTWNMAIQNLKNLGWIQEDEFKYTIKRYNKNISKDLAYTMLPKALELNGYLFLFYWELYESFFINHSIDNKNPFVLARYMKLYYKSYKAENYWLFREMLDYFQNYGLLEYEVKDDIKTNWNPKIIIKSMERSTIKLAEEHFWKELS